MISFLFGLFFGNFVGMFIMALCQTSKESELKEIISQQIHEKNIVIRELRKLQGEEDAEESSR